MYGRCPLFYGIGKCSDVVEAMGLAAGPALFMDVDIQGVSRRCRKFSHGRTGT